MNENAASTNDPSADDEALANAEVEQADSEALAYVEANAPDYSGWALAEYDTDQGRVLVRYPSDKLASARAPEKSKIWSRAKMWAENSKIEDYYFALQEEHPDLCNVDDVRRHQVDWKVQRVWPVLLALAEDGSEEGDETMAKDTERRGASRGRGVKTKKEKTNGAGRGRKSSLDTTKKIRFAEEFKLREGTATAKRFEGIKSGMTVATALERGLRADDIRFHEKKGNLSLE